MKATALVDNVVTDLAGKPLNRGESGEVDPKLACAWEGHCACRITEHDKPPPPPAKPVLAIRDPEEGQIYVTDKDGQRIRDRGAERMAKKRTEPKASKPKPKRKEKTGDATNQS